MSIDTTFKPLGPTVPINGTPAQAVPAPSGFSAGITTFRIFNQNGMSTTFGWGLTAAAAAYAAGNANSIPGSWLWVNGETAIYLELPYNTWFCVGTGETFSFTPGQGGVGG
jgi:hypothetical protein